MDVHHHSHQPKKWKEYITEFLMLFIAVTLGFFAENLREHKVIEHKMSENYTALIDDLRQDSINIRTIFKKTEKFESNFVKFDYLLYQNHKKEINWNTFKRKISELGPLPSYHTLFINNTTFKNMQSSGLLSYIELKDLKSSLSYYYEIEYKRIDDNNKLFDQTGILFFNTQLPQRERVRITSDKEYLLNGYPSEFKNKESYSKYLLNLPSTKYILTQEKLIYDLNVYVDKYYDYNKILHNILLRNMELIKKLKKYQN